MSNSPSPSCVSSFQFLENQNGDSPCVIIETILKTSCPPEQAYTIFRLSSGQAYPPPTPQQASPCLCNSVTYSLLSTCTYCQGFGGSMKPFSSWTTTCSNGIVEEGKIPNTTAFPIQVPQWAFQPLGSDEQFNITAINPEVSPSSTSTPASIITQTGPIAQTVPSSLPASITTGSANAKTSKDSRSNSLQILIAIVVVVTLLIIIAIVVIYVIFRRRNGKKGKRTSLSSFFYNHRYSLIPSHHRRISTTDSETFVDPLPTVTVVPPEQPGLFASFRRFFGFDNGRVSPFLRNTTQRNVPNNVNPQKAVPQPLHLVGAAPRPGVSALRGQFSPRKRATELSPRQRVTELSPRQHVTELKTLYPHSPKRPDAIRFQTLPVFQTVTPSSNRPRPTRSLTDPTSPKSPTGLRSPTGTGTGNVHHVKKSSNESAVSLARPRPDRINPVPRPSNWKIDQTPTAVEPTSRPPWDADVNHLAAVPAPIFNPQYEPSVRSIASQSTGRSHPRPPRRAGSEDSDSVALLSSPSAWTQDSGSARSVGGFEAGPSPPHSANEAEGSIRSYRSNRSQTSARSDRTNVSGRTLPPPPISSTHSSPQRKQSFGQMTDILSSDTHSTPLSPAAPSSHFHGDEFIDPTISRFTGPDARMRLFPSAVRAAGYTGVPFDTQAQTSPSPPQSPPRPLPRQGRSQ